MNDTFLSPTVPRWNPTNEADIQDGISSGILEETHYLDLKREIGSSASANKELARDLAQFAVDGGTLLIGVEELKNGPPQLSPVTLAGLPERVEQVAHSIPDPPIAVATRAIDRGDGTGYLLVQVPASSTAPHMVEGIYYGRGDKVRQRLSDQEVRRLHSIQAKLSEYAAREIAEYVERDPVPADKRQQAHLFVVAVPVVPRPEMALSLTHGAHSTERLFGLVRRSSQVGNPPGGFSPSLAEAGSFQRRGDGLALTTYGLGEGRQIVQEGPRFNEDLLEVELSEEGTIRLLTTRLSDAFQDGRQRVFVVMIPTLVRQVIELAAAISVEVGYSGRWSLGVTATGMGGMVVQQKDLWREVRIPDDSYARFAHASTLELAAHPGLLVERLVGRFLRGIGMDQAPENRIALS